MTEFKYAPMFQMGEDKTEYRLLTKEGVTVSEFEGKEIVKVSPEALTLLAQQAFHDVEFMLRREHNLQVAQILRDPEASENDKYVALQFLRNAETACKGILPFCPRRRCGTRRGLRPLPPPSPTAILSRPRADAIPSWPF